jgi:hypothetical protein
MDHMCVLNILLDVSLKYINWFAMEIYEEIKMVQH